MATLPELENALRKAHAAGNADHARAFASEIRRLRTEPAKPDFSNVQSGASTAPAGAPASWLDRQKQGAGLAARSMLQGGGSLVGMLGGDAINALVADPIERAVTGNDVQTTPMRDRAAGLADRLGLPTPQTSGQRIASDVGEALTGAAGTMGIGSALSAGAGLVPTVSSRLGQLLTTQPALQAVSATTGAAAAGATREGGGSRLQQLGAGLLGGLSPGAASGSLSALMRGAIRGGDGAQMQRTAQDFAALGASPSVGQASGNRLVQGAENLLAGGPTSAGVMNRFAERQAEDIGEGLQGIATGLSRRPSGESAGRAIADGVDTFRGNARAQQRALYWQADRHIPDATPVPTQHAWQEVVRLTSPIAGAQATTGALIHPRIAQLRQNLEQDLAANGGTLPYSALRAIRSQIGEQISDFSMTPDAPTRQLRQLYGALSRDMEAAAAAAGPQASAAARRANTYTRTLNDRLEDVQRVVDKNGGPEAVFNAAMSGTRDGGTTLRKVMQSLPAESQRSVTAAVIRRMGMATPGAQDATGDVFSAATFLTNWNRVSPEAKRALFDRHGQGFARDMDRVARVASNIKEGSKVFANPSGTANRAAAMTYGAALVGSMFTGGTGGLVVSGLAANGAARWLTNPRAVSWLARTTELPRGSIPGTINAMRTEGNREQDEALLELAAELEQRIGQEANGGQEQQR